MPPFGAEKEEAPNSKPLPFLSVRSHDRVKQLPSCGPFGSEPAESFSGPPSKKPCSQPSQSRHQPSTRSVLWGAEPEEVDNEVNIGQPLSGSSSGSEGEYRGSANTVFSLGWNTLLDLKKASFWKESVNTVISDKKKRKYNNTERAAMASYSRQNSAGYFKENGVDVARLQKLFALPTCQCALVLGCLPIL